MVVWASTDENPVRVGGFLVRGDSPGITVLPTWDHLGSAGEPQRRRAVHRRRGAARGHRRAGRARQRARPARRAHRLELPRADRALPRRRRRRASTGWSPFLNDRVPTNLGAPLATLPRFQQAVGEIAVSLAGASTLVRALAERVDAGDPGAVSQAAGAKTLGTRAAITAVEQALSLTGNHGLTRNHPLQRHYRDVLCSRVHTPQDDVIISAAGRAALSPKGA